ncbi:MAG TPA: efflux RND transporter permease subunit [Pseudobdellovibrionaceae bacterium]|nr:efflux RND transporter permease subunit [Pseudobdellovibrionaceae bacterium]
MKSLIRFFYSQHLFANLMTALVIGAGAISLFTIRKDLFPKVEFDVTLVTAVFPGASPDQVEKLIVNPLEQAIREVDGLKKVQSQALDSRAVITITLDPDARDPDKTNDDIQRAIDQVDDYPTDAERPVVVALESGQTPVIELSVTSATLSELELRAAAKYIADEISNLPGVAKVSKDGWRRQEFKVLVDQEKLTRQHIALSNIVDAVRSHNVQLPAGELQLPNGREMSVKTDGEFRSAEDLASATIRSNFEGYGVRIADVGEVQLGLEKPSILYRTNGKPGFKLTIIKKERADALKTVEVVKAGMEKIKANLPSGVETAFINDFTFYLKNRLSTLGGNMAMGVILVCVVLALFLPFRVALVVAIGIPFSMLLAILTIQYYGYSLNLISLIGLIIVSGMLVDDTIIVTENIWRRLENGEDFTTAIVDGATEMIAPVTASVLTTVAAFGPMLFMTGIFGKFVFEIPLLVILPLLYSLIEAFIMAPAHFQLLIGPQLRAYLARRKAEQHQAVRTETHWYERWLPKYRALIAMTVRRRYAVLGLFVGVLVVTAIATTQMRFILFPPEGIYTFFVRVDAEPGASLDEMTAMLAEVEPQLAQLPKSELVDYTTMVGIQQEEPSDPLTKRASHYGQILVNLSPEGERDRGVNEIVEELRQRIQKPKGATKLAFSIAQGGPPQGRPISINIYGEDFAVLREIANKVKVIMKEVEGVQDIEDSEVIGKREVKVSPIPSLVSQAGLTNREIATTVRAAFAGLVASSSRTLDEEIDIRVQLKPPPKGAEQQLKDLKIGTLQGNLVPLHKVAQFEETDSRLIIQHERYKRILNVSASVNLDKTTAMAATKLLQEKLKDVLKDTPTYEISFAGENEDTAESMASLARAFVVAAVLIFLILVLTFQSFLQPLLVLLALPLGFMGVVFALLLHGKPLSFMAMLGIIALAGVIVNNAIVYIDFFNSRRADGLSLDEALVDAATTRLRPIILTSLTTVLGLMPTAYGIGGSDGFVATLALALGWGLMMGSFLTVLVFPAILRIVADLQEIGARGFRRSKLGTTEN